MVGFLITIYYEFAIKSKKSEDGEKGEKNSSAPSGEAEG